MSKNIADKDLRTLGIVLRRINYGEADRILNLITPVGKISAIARGVRKARSKLAGGVEMFCLSDLQVHRGRSELGVVTSARMTKHYNGILKDYERMQLAGLILKEISVAAEHTDSVEWFEVTRQCLEELDNGVDRALVESWFWLNLLRISGEEVNLYRDVAGEKLEKDARYDWNIYEKSFVKDLGGDYGADEIKLLRLMTTSGLPLVKRVKLTGELQGRVLELVQKVVKK